MNRRLKEAEEVLKNFFGEQEPSDEVSQPIQDGNPTDDQSPEIDEEIVQDTPAVVQEQSPDGHNWEKRKTDAQEAQRRLAEERRMLEQERIEVNSNRALLEDQQREIARLLAEKVIAEQPRQEDVRDEFAEEYPDLAAAVDSRAKKATEPLRNELEQAKAELERMKNEQVEGANKRKGQFVIAQVVKQIPNAIQIAKSDEFDTWVKGLPRTLSSQYRDVIARTSLYTPEDAVFVLKAFLATKNQSPDVIKPTSKVRDAAVVVRPDSPVRVGDRVVRPLTPNELQNISSLVRSAKTNEERTLWSERLRLTYTQ